MKKGFTLVELLVVVGMIALLTGAVGNSVNEARKRARVAKAHAEVKEMTNAILAYENYNPGNLPTMESADATRANLGFILGENATDADGNEIPVLFNANVSHDGKIRDPWGRPYLVTIREGNATLNFKSASSNMQTGYFLPNFYRLSVGERE